MLSTPHHFYWDPDKAASNYRKHGVPFEEAMIAIEDPLALTRHDVNHSRAEERWITIGEADGTLLHVVHTLEDSGDSTSWVRIISARHPTPDERRQYESGKYRIEEAVMINESNPNQWVRGRFYREGVVSEIPVYVARDIVIRLIRLSKQRGVMPSELANMLLTDALSQPPPIVAAGAENPG